MLAPYTEPLTGTVYYPHYWSTYCIHGNCSECRLTCKTCQAPCRCPCHHTTQHDGAECGHADLERVLYLAVLVLFILVLLRVLGVQL